MAYLNSQKWDVGQHPYVSSFFLPHHKHEILRYLAKLANRRAPLAVSLAPFVHSLRTCSTHVIASQGDFMKKQKCFSLIELLIVVAIILIIAAIAIPNLLRSRIAANEASAVGSIRSINTSQVTYASTYPDAGFAPALVNLGPISGTSPTSAAAGLLDGVLGCGTQPCAKSGYKFNVTGGNTTYAVNAAPS